MFLFQINILSQSSFPSERAKRDYEEIISLYPNFLVSHFPESINDSKFANHGLLFPRGRYLCYIHLMIPYGDEEIGPL